LRESTQNWCETNGKKSETNGNIKNAFKGVKDIENYKKILK